MIGLRGPHFYHCEDLFLNDQLDYYLLLRVFFAYNNTLATTPSDKGRHATDAFEIKPNRSASQSGSNRLRAETKHTPSGTTVLLAASSPPVLEPVYTPAPGKRCGENALPPRGSPKSYCMMYIACRAASPACTLLRGRNDLLCRAFANVSMCFNRACGHAAW